MGKKISSDEEEERVEGNMQDKKRAQATWPLMNQIQVRLFIYFLDYSYIVYSSSFVFDTKIRTN